MVTMEYFKKRIEQTASNFKFRQDADFKPFAEIIFDNIKTSSQEQLDKKFQQIWLTPSEEWHKKYGYGGYPCLSDWIFLLTGKRPLTDQEKVEIEKARQETIKSHTQTILVWLNDRNLETLFLSKYKNPENNHLKKVIDQFLGIKEQLSDERIVKMANYLKKLYLEDKKGIFEKLQNIADKETRLINSKIFLLD